MRSVAWGSVARPSPPWREELGVGRKFLYLWRERLQAGGKAALERGRGRPPGEQIEISFYSQPSVAAGVADRRTGAQLLGRKQVELDFFKRTFEHVRGAAVDRTSDGGKGSMAASKPRSHSKE